MDRERGFCAVIWSLPMKWRGDDAHLSRLIAPGFDNSMRQCAIQCSIVGTKASGAAPRREGGIMSGCTPHPGPPPCATITHDARTRNTLWVSWRRLNMYN